MRNAIKVAALAALTACGAATSASAWEPTKAVEIVVAAGAGGASDPGRHLTLVTSTVN